jgi:hypothetical protein
MVTITIPYAPPYQPKTSEECGAQAPEETVWKLQVELPNYECTHADGYDPAVSDCAATRWTDFNPTDPSDETWLMQENFDAAGKV